MAIYEFKLGPLCASEFIMCRVMMVMVWGRGWEAKEDDDARKVL